MEVPCPDPASGLYIQTRSGQIVKVQLLVLCHDCAILCPLLRHVCVMINVLKN